MATKTITINRAPVLTLWAAVVAERLGFDEGEALSMGKALAGLNAQTKGRRLGIFQPHEEKADKARLRDMDEIFGIELCGRPVPVRNTKDGLRAVKGSQVIDPAGVERYLQGKFGDDLAAIRRAMRQLAQHYRPRELAQRAFPLYERFRPEIPEGVRGWGARGTLDVDLIKAMAKE